MSSRKSRKKKHKKEPRISPSSSRDEKKARDTKSLSSLQSQHKHHRHERASCSSVKDEAKEKRSSDLPASTSKASSHTERSKTTDFRKSKEKRSPERKATGNSKTLSSPVREEKEKANFKRKHDNSSPRSSGKSSSRHTAARPLFSKELEEQRRKLVSRRSAPDEPIRRQDDLSHEELQEKRRKLMKRSSSGELHSDAKRRDWTSSDLTHAIPRSEDLKEMRKKLVSGRPKEVDHQTIGRIKPKSEDKTISDHSKEVLPVVKCVNSGTKPKVPEDISHKQQHFTKKHAPGAIFGEEKPSSGSMPKISFKIPKKASNFKAQNTHIWKPVLSACDSRTQKTQPSHTDSAVAGSPSTNPPHISQQQEKRPPVVSSQTSNKPSSACLSSPLYLSNRVQQVQTNKTREVTTSSKTPSKAEHTPHPESTSDAGETFYSDQEMELVEELHLARSERRLEVNLVESCGELTCMDIDPPEDGASTILNKGQQLLIVLDTNVLLSHLDFVKKIRSLGLGALGFPTLLIPWVVLQELDFLKSGKLSSKVEDKARPAVHYIYSCLKNQEPRLMGQSMQQASQAVCGPGVMNNDDRVLQCCLQYQALYPGGALALCTNDKNLCSKALLSGVKALSKADLVKEVEGSRPTILDNLHTHPTVLPPAGPGEKEQEGPDLRNQSNEAEDRELSECVSVLEACLQGALSEVLTEEMRAAYGDLWTEIVYVKPPWSLDGVLKCFRKHWIAVFGSIIKRGLLGSVEMLSDCLCSDRSVERRSVQSAVRTSAELLSAFAGRSQYSGGVGQALSTLHMLQKKLQSPKAPAVCIDDEDSLMAEVEEDIAPPTHASHQEVWALFESIWNNVCQISSALFSAFHYTPGSTEPNLQPTSPPPQEAVSCLHWLSAALRQLLESLQRLLSVDGSIEDAQSLLSFIQASEIAAMEPRFTAGDLFDCVSQQEYREKLCVGGAQLSELSANLDRCAATLSSWP